MSLIYADDKLVRGSEVLELYQEAQWTSFGGREAAQVEESIRHAWAFLTVRDGARLVGFVSALSDRVYYVHVTELLVRRGYDDRGVGSELLRRFLEVAGRDRQVSIFAEPDAEPFYRRFGFLATAGGMLLRPGGGER